MRRHTARSSASTSPAAEYAQTSYWAHVGGARAPLPPALPLSRHAGRRALYGLLLPGRPAGRRPADAALLYLEFTLDLSRRASASHQSGFHGESTRFEPPGVSPNSPSSHATCRPPGVRGEAPGNENASSQRLASRFARRGDTLSRSATPRVGVLDRSNGPGGGAAGVAGTSDQRTPSRPWRAAAVAAAGATASSSSSSRRPRGDVGPGGTGRRGERGDAVGAAARAARARRRRRAPRRRRRRRRAPPPGPPPA